jgi:hypothetical protein
MQGSNYFVMPYRCESRSLPLIEERKPWVSDGSGPRRIFRNEMLGGFRKHDLYSSLSEITMVKARRMRWTGYEER